MKAANSIWSPRKLFANGEQGAWYDPSDLTTLYQDSAGTTPVTAVEQPVGLMLDKSKGLVLGPELVANGTFDTNITGWMVGNTGQSTLTWADGKLRITRVNAGVTYPNARTTLTGLTVGRIYKIVSATNNPFGIEAYHSIEGIGLSAVRTTLASKTLECVFTATTTSHNLDVGIWGSSGSVGQYVEFDNISVRELPGNHAYQSTSANRPVLSARVNLLTKTEDFSDATWITGNVTKAQNAITENSTLGEHNIYKGIVLPAANYTFSVECGLQSGTRYAAIQIATNNADNATGRYTVVVDLSTGLVVSEASGASTTGKNKSVVAASSGRWRISVSANHSSGTVYGVIGMSNSASPTYNPSSNPEYTGDGSSSIYIWGADFRVTNTGVDLPAYQRVNTSTDYDTTGFPLYLRTNGTSSAMQTNSIDFTATDKMTVFAGVRKLNDAANGMPFELSSITDSNPGTFHVASVTTAGWQFTSGGPIRQAVYPSGYPAPITNVLTGIGNISGDTAILRVNGTQAAIIISDQGTGNFGNYPLYLFARGGTSLWFNGNFYGAVIRGAQSTQAQIEATENWINGKTKAY